MFPEWKITKSVMEVKEKYDIKVNYLLNDFDESNHCFFIIPGVDFNTSNLVWKNDKYWDNNLTRDNLWSEK